MGVGDGVGEPVTVGVGVGDAVAVDDGVTDGVMDAVTVAEGVGLSVTQARGRAPTSAPDSRMGAVDAPEGISPRAAAGMFAAPGVVRAQAPTAIPASASTVGARVQSIPFHLQDDDKESEEE